MLLYTQENIGRPVSSFMFPFGTESHPKFDLLNSIFLFPLHSLPRKCGKKTLPPFFPFEPILSYHPTPCGKDKTVEDSVPFGRLPILPFLLSPFFSVPKFFRPPIKDSPSAPLKNRNTTFYSPTSLPS